MSPDDVARVVDSYLTNVYPKTRVELIKLLKQLIKRWEGGASE